MTESAMESVEKSMMGSMSKRPMSCRNAQVISVDVRKLSDGIQQIFLGCASVFDSLGAQMEEGMLPDIRKLELPENGKKPEISKPEQNTEPDAVKPEEKKAVSERAAKAADADRNVTEKPAEEKAASMAKEAKPNESTVTVNDIIRIASAKITANRKNGDKIQKLIAAYGAFKLSELPEEKYEAFLTDISQL